MRIDKIDVFLVAMPLISPWRTAYGEDATVESILVRMTSGSTSAWGESTPLAAPCYSPEWAGGVYACVCKWLAPALVGQTIDSGEALQKRLAHFKGNPFAKAALDTAWWSLFATLAGKPLYQMLGGQRDRVEVGADFGVHDSLEELMPKIDDVLRQGFSRVKLKYRPGWDIPMLRAVRQVFPTQRFHIDCNSAYSLDDLSMFGRVDDFCLEMIEQPLAHDDLLDHAALQAKIRTKICLDESINSIMRAEQAIALGSCKYVNIKPARVGGLTPALAIHDLCQEAGIPCWVGGMLESAVGVRLCLALATLPNFTYPADIFPSSGYYTEDLGTPPVELLPIRENPPLVVHPPNLAQVQTAPATGRYIANLQQPGIGAEPHPARLKACQLAQQSFG